MGATRTRTIAVVDDLRYRDHRAPPGHPECPERLAAVGEEIRRRADRLRPLAPRPADEDELLRVHPLSHVARIASLARRAPIHVDPDTYLSPESYEVARLAAGAAVDVALGVARGEAAAGLAAVRPPGHHAEPDRAMGFCLFNNVAVAARALQRREGIERILIVDWDVHHGNGTQHAFEDDRDVLFFSSHQFPFYPGTGSAEEAGRGAGAGATVNLPLPAGCGDADYLAAYHRLLVPVARAFRPEIVLVSCGFDAHRDDPLAMMELSGEGYAGLARLVRALADDLCGGRLVCLLEGGYAPSGLREGTAAVLDALLDPDPAALPPAPSLEPGSGAYGALERVARVHGDRYRDLRGS